MTREHDPQGKAALFSGGRPPEGVFRLECEQCGETSRVGLAKLVRLAIPINMTNPFRYHHTWMRCPACDARSWLRIRPAR